MPTDWPGSGRLLYIREQGPGAIRDKELALMRRFHEQAAAIPGVCIYGDFDQEERAAIVALNLGDEDSGEVSDYLAQEHGIYTRSGGHCAPLMHEALGTREQGAVRFSFSHFNTVQEVDLAAAASGLTDDCTALRMDRWIQTHPSIKPHRQHIFLQYFRQGRAAAGVAAHNLRMVSHLVQGAAYHFV